MNMVHAVEYGAAGLARAILERLAIGKRVGFRYRTMQRLGLAALHGALAQGILREIHQAQTIPDPHGRTLYDLEVRRTPEGIIAVSQTDDEWIEPLQLVEDDIRQFELVLPKLCARICLANGICQAIQEHDHEIVYLGELELTGYGRLMTFLLYNNTGELLFIERCRQISGDHWTLALTPAPICLTLQYRRQLTDWRILPVPMLLHLRGDSWKLSWRTIVVNLAGQPRALTGLRPLEDHVFEHLPGLGCSPDFRTVHLRGEAFALTPKMAQLFKAMVEMSLRGPRDLAKDAILERGESRSRNLADVFKHLKHWKRLIAAGRQQGTYRINIPDPLPTP